MISATAEYFHVFEMTIGGDDPKISMVDRVLKKFSSSSLLFASQQN